jgi:TatD DNase family protein
MRRMSPDPVPMFMDTHCHLADEALRERVPEVLAAAKAAGVGRVVTIGTGIADSRAGQSLAHQHPGVFFTAGLHPLHAEESPDKGPLLEALRELSRDPRCVALGEMGQDKHYAEPTLAMQRASFEWQLELAAQTGLPVVIHNRKATAETLAILRQTGLPAGRFLFHCFTGGPAEAEDILAFGALIGFAGAVTFKNGRDIAEAFDRVPLDRVVVETDSPYLTPEPHRGVRPNEPRHVVDVAAFLARRRGLLMADFARATSANAERFYRLPPAGVGLNADHF